MIACIFMYLGDGSLVLRYIWLMSKHPNLALGVDMTLFTRILVVSNPDVSILFYLSYSNMFPPAVSLIIIGSSFLWVYI